MIRLNVFIKVSAEKRAEVLATINELTEKSRREKGCVDYGAYENSQDPRVLMICETWEDETALAAHEKTGHFITLVGKTQQLAEMKLEKFTF